MILHASFTVDAPQVASEAVADLMGGMALPFPELGQDAWIALAGDQHGTLIEFMKRGTEFHYKAGGAVAHRHGPEVRHTGCHVLIESPHEEELVFAIAERHGCRAHPADHGPLNVIEFWIEDCLLIEVASPARAAIYKQLAALPNVRSMVDAMAGV